MFWQQAFQQATHVSRSRGMKNGLFPALGGLASKGNWKTSKGWKGFGGSLKHTGKSAWGMSFKGAMIFNAPIAALSMGMAPRGAALSSGAGALSTGIGSLIGGLAFGTPGAIVGGLVADSAIGESISRGVQAVHDIGRKTARLDMGGDWQDNETAFTMRQAALREMSGSLQNARQWLGREANLMHG